MSSQTIFSMSIPTELLNQLNKISINFGTDLNSDMVHLMECYVDSFQKLHADSASKALLEVK